MKNATRKARHTSGEWTAAKVADAWYPHKFMIETPTETIAVDSQATALKIVTAVNSFDLLLQACEALVNTIEPPLPKKRGRKGRNDYKIELEPFFVEPMNQARAAIKKAKGE